MYWAVSLAEQIVKLQTYFVNRSQRNTRNIVFYVDLFNALVLLNVGYYENYS